MMSDASAPLVLSTDYETHDVISIHYRHFSVWLRDDLLAPLSGVVTEIEFPWSESAMQNNFQHHLDNIAQHALDTMALIDNTLRTENCKIIYCEVNKYACAVSLLAPLPQLVYQGMQSMPCPSIFSLPTMTNHEVSASHFVKERRSKLSF
ncbi:hypothetical protein [Salinimonas chungwhensis]|uniref:hypothetical protein n=1 Tax=Salinimonas chungwhensis TaxID=265425 RepID=UPI00037883D8|nr:hypothetical protein [Salinimonas chungwhensis]